MVNNSNTDQMTRSTNNWTINNTNYVNINYQLHIYLYYICTSQERLDPYIFTMLQCILEFHDQSQH